MRSRRRLGGRVIRIVLLLAVVVVAAIAANVALLSVAAGSHERVGQLSPVLAVSSPGARPTATRAGSRGRPQPPGTGKTKGSAHADEDDGEADD
jgi:hypothetical protein